MGLLKRLLLVFALWCLVSAAQAAVRVQADRNPVSVGEEFNLLFTIEGLPGVTPDFTPLERDFEIFSTSNSTNVQIINGKGSQTSSWRLTLYPKVAGTLAIPSLNFGSEVSPATSITVTEEVPQSGAAKNADILVELEVDVPNPYVQQEVIVTQRLLHSVALMPTQASMSHPELDKGQGVLHQLGAVRKSSLKRNGVNYQVIERRYAVFPQTSGELSIGRTVFEGVLDDPASRRRDPFGLRGKRVRRFSQPLVLQVRPQEQKAAANWLPARSLSLNAYWQPASDQLKAGEPVTLTLAVMADGLLAEQLPALDVKPPMGIKGYANQPEFRNDLGGDSAIGVREEKWVLIGTADGEFLLPEIKLDWWNVKTGKPETARIPATKLKVSGAGVAAPAPVSPTAEQGSSGPAAAESGQEPGLLNAPAEEPLLPDASLQPEEALSPLRFWPLAVATLVLLTAGLLWWARRRRKARLGKLSGERTYKRGAAPLAQLQQACQRNDAHAALQALHSWIKDDLQLTPPTIAALRARAGLPLRQELDDLNTVLFASAHELWEGKGLWKQVQAFRQTPVMAEAEPMDGLEHLYPD